jgi:hypothetical protein
MEVSGLALHPGYFTPGGKEPQVPIEWEAGWALEPVLMSGEEKNFFCMVGIELWIIQPIP